MHVDVTNMFGICSFVVIVSEAEFKKDKPRLFYSTFNTKWRFRVLCIKKDFKIIIKSNA